ncbi:hypothetical protein [Microbacterium terricola]|uniref:NADH:ubiquinone oxidoreductase n=1 Tax=Microbacterium terricola TaxID=344163 RepID=A0ABM8DZI6_9MICO|nr:hypothetical protein [Microbacterium terricola]UYK41298.1 hypothetical protein OAU46_06615 [Microbacterium terricola]BDV30920.1 hypothetical protein Microterr_15800 [Microbacterium terricola]
MREYVFGTGLIGAATSGMTLLRSLRAQEPFTWRTVLAWVSWGITVALVVGAVIDTRDAKRGRIVSGDSPVSGREQKLLKKRLRR